MGLEFSSYLEFSSIPGGASPYSGSLCNPLYKLSQASR